MLYLKRMTHGLVATVFVTCALTFTPVAKAQDNPRINANSFMPSVHSNDIISVLTANQPGHLKMGGGLFLTWNSEPLAITDSTGATLIQNINHQAIGDFIFNIGITDYLSIGLDVPVFLYSEGDAPSNENLVVTAVDGISIGDIRLGLKASVFGKKRIAGFGVAVASDFTFQTAYPEHFNGEPLVTWIPKVAVDWVHKGWQVALNVGYHLRDDVAVTSAHTVGDEFLLSAGLVVPFMCGILEGVGTLDYRAAVEEGTFDEKSHALVMLGGLRGHVGPMTLMAAAGGGVLEGYGQPKYRVVFSVGYDPEVEMGCFRDTDKDGICDKEDRCPKNAGPAEYDGCPDTDGDTIPDIDDKCPKVKGEPRFEGCPDTDGDGIEDAKDRCPEKSGPEKFKGCPDTDGDGIADPDDECPTVPGKVEHKGCPDTDGDGIRDKDDKCPDVFGKKEFGGCPPPTPKTIKITNVKIEITEKVHFKTDKAKIMSDSFGLLKDVAKVINENDHIKKIRVEGHTDDRGSEEYNMELSQQRAQSVVDFLIKEGVDAGRVEPVGFGKTHPLVDNATDEGKAKNRRVEFVIVED